MTNNLLIFLLVLALGVAIAGRFFPSVVNSWFGEVSAKPAPTPEVAEVPETTPTPRISEPPEDINSTETEEFLILEEPDVKPVAFIASEASTRLDVHVDHLNIEEVVILIDNKPKLILYKPGSEKAIGKPLLNGVPANIGSGYTSSGGKSTITADENGITFRTTGDEACVGDCGAKSDD